MSNVIEFKPNERIYLELAEKAADEGRFYDALKFAYDAWNESGSKDAAEMLAMLYADMELYDLSDKFWFYVLERSAKGQCGRAYEELAINAFYKSNFVLTGYYFHRKMEEDGFVNKENLDDALLDFISEGDKEKSSVKIVYPPDAADFSDEIEQAERAVVCGNFSAAIEILEKIPTKSKQGASALKLLAEAYYLGDDDKNSLEASKEYLNNFGENAGVYSTVACVYSSKKNTEKSEYYYRKALACLDEKDYSDVGKVANCALNLKDFVSAVKLLEIFLTDRPYAKEVRFMFAVSLINIFEYEKGAEQFRKLISIDPFNPVYAYYYSLSKDILNGKKQSALPLNFLEVLPRTKRRENEKIITEAMYSVGITNKKQKRSREKLMQAIKEEIFCDDSRIINSCAYLLIEDDSEESKSILFDSLLDERVSDRNKREIVYSILFSGYKRKFSLSISGVFIKIIVRKLACEKIDSKLAIPYYFTLSELTPVEESEQARLAAVAERVLSRTNERVEERNNELSAIIAAEFFGNKLPIELACETFSADIGTVKRMLKNNKTKKEDKND